MAALIIPDSRFEMPELFYPNRKPVGNVKIDWSHPLARGLTMCLIFQMGRGYVDLVSGRRASTVAGSVIEPKGAYFDEVDDYIIMSDVVLNRSYSITMDCAYTDNDGSGFQYIFSFDNVAADDSLNIAMIEAGAEDAGKLRCFSDNINASSRIVNAQALYPSNTQFSLAVDSQDASVYVAGVLDANNTTFGDTSMSDGTTKDLYIGGRTDLNADRFAGGHAKHVFIHARKLSANDACLLNANPYQFLIPA